MKRQIYNWLATLLTLCILWASAGLAASTVPKGLENLEHLNALPEQADVDGQRTFVFSPRLQEWAAYDEDGFLVASGPANGGADKCLESDESCRTPEGTFKVFRKKGESCQSSQFPIHDDGTRGGAAMPYCMFFNHGVAIHGSPYLSQDNDSHGCVRVKTAAAQWLQRYFIRIGTQVVVLPY